MNDFEIVEKLTNLIVDDCGCSLNKARVILIDAILNAGEEIAQYLVSFGN